MRLGFTTSVFARPLATGEVNLGGLVDFAEEQGFVAIELRDEDAAYGLGDVQDFVKDTSAKSIEVTYAIKNDMFLPEDEALVRRGIERAALCGDGAIMRILASQSALAPADKKGYTADEIEKLARISVDYSKIAEEKGIYLAVEHAREPLYGDGQTYFGLADLLKALEASGAMPGNFGITFDPANAVYTSLCKAPTTADKVFEFLDTQSQHVTLVHLKTTVEGKTTPTLQDADIENEALFSKLSKVYDGIICVEIPAASDLAECRRNIDASLEYLRKQGLMGYFAQA
jgi:hypothetical protein